MPIDELVKTTPAEVIKMLWRFVQEVQNKDKYVIVDGLDDGSKILDVDLGVRNYFIEFTDANTGKQHELRARLSSKHPEYMVISIDRDKVSQRGDWVPLPEARLIVGTGSSGASPFFCIRLTFARVILSENDTPRDIVFACYPFKDN